MIVEVNLVGDTPYRKLDAPFGGRPVFARFEGDPSMIARIRRAKTGDDGASAVEMALVLPVLILLVFGIIAFGIVFAQSLALSNAAREGARSAVVEQRTCGEILSTVQAAANSISMSGDDVAVTVTRDGGSECPSGTTYTSAQASNIPCDGSDAGDEITVTADFESSLIIPLFVYNPSFDLDGEGVFRCEFS